VFVLQMMNGIGDNNDLRPALNRRLRPNFDRMSTQQLEEYAALNGHCSALVKVRCFDSMVTLVLI